MLTQPSLFIDFRRPANVFAGPVSANNAAQSGRPANAAGTPDAITFAVIGAEAADMPLLSTEVVGEEGGQFTSVTYGEEGGSFQADGISFTAGEDGNADEAVAAEDAALLEEAQMQLDLERIQEQARREKQKIQAEKAENFQAEVADRINTIKQQKAYRSNLLDYYQSLTPVFGDTVNQFVAQLKEHIRVFDEHLDTWNRQTQVAGMITNNFTTADVSNSIPFDTYVPSNPMTLNTRDLASLAIREHNVNGQVESYLDAKSAESLEIKDVKENEKRMKHHPAMFYNNRTIDA